MGIVHRYLGLITVLRKGSDSPRSFSNHARCCWKSTHLHAAGTDAGEPDGPCTVMRGRKQRAHCMGGEDSGVKNAPLSEQMEARCPLASSSNNGAMTSPSQNLVGPQVRRLRMAAGLSQEAFSAKLQLFGWDLSRGGLSKIEAGLRRVNDAELWLLARGLSTPLIDLFPARPRGVAAVARQGRG